MPTDNEVAKSLIWLAQDQDMMEIARKAIEDVLIDFRDNHIFTLRNNGLVIKSYGGEDSHIIAWAPKMPSVLGLMQ
jgi:ketopantoate reductase